MEIRRRPLYLEVIDVLMRDIQEGRYPPGAKLPSEEQLAREMGISRVSLREALRVLAEDGVLFRRHGSGTYVRDQKATPVQDLSTILSISTMFKKAGLEHQVLRADHRKIPAARRVAENLRIQPGEEVWEMERLRGIGGKPALYSFDYFPADLVPAGGERRIRDYSFATYYFLCEVCGQKIDRGKCTLKPVLADERLQEIMKLPRHTPLMFIEIVDLNPEQKPVSYAREYYRADFFDFQVNRRWGDADL
jgi:DNA-binding GntR family transcriptional regulator